MISRRKLFGVVLGAPVAAAGIASAKVAHPEILVFRDPQAFQLQYIGEPILVRWSGIDSYTFWTPTEASP